MPSVVWDDEVAKPQTRKIVWDDEVTPQEAPLKWSDVPGKAISNIPSSAGNLVSGIYDAVRHPIDTVKNVIGIGAGALQNALPEGLVNAINSVDPNAKAGAEARAMADQVGQFYKGRYGSEEGIKGALSTDPVGVAADAATLLTGGGAAAGKIPGLSRAGQMAVQAGKAIDPLANAVKLGAKAASGTGALAANLIGELGTHTGGQTIKDAAAAGAAGGAKRAEFLDNMRGNVPLTDVLDSAKEALQQIRADRGAQYRQSMQGVKADKTVLNFTPIDKAMNDALAVSSFKGKSINRSAADVQDKISKVVAEWKGENPAEFHTAEGLDALKQTIGDIRDSTEFGTPSRVVADRVYNSVKNQIVQQAPEYANAMKDYAEASTLVKEIERSLSLGNKASADTAMRKLQSLTRNNVNTNYGTRVELAKELEAAGAENLLSNLSAQSLNTFAPRGLGRVVAGATGIGGVMAMNPYALPLLAAQSPRLMGEAAVKAGQLGGMLKDGTGAVTSGLNKAGIDPTILANYLYQMNQPKQQGSQR